jgi:hypothetical protein
MVVPVNNAPTTSMIKRKNKHIIENFNRNISPAQPMTYAAS